MMRRRRDPYTPVRRLQGLALGAALCALLLAACAPVQTPKAPTETERLPVRTLEDAVHYQVVDEGTLVYARVFRDGRLARLGHNHVVVFSDVRGDVYLAGNPGESLFDLLVAPAASDVDPPALRREQGGDFQSDISDGARARTRANMLGEGVLDAAAHPYVRVSSVAFEGRMEKPRVTLDITIHGQTRRMTVPFVLEVGGGILRARGQLALLQTDFGIEPFSTLGGALKVKNRVELEFEIAARRV